LYSLFFHALLAARLPQRNCTHDVGEYFRQLVFQRRPSVRPLTPDRRSRPRPSKARTFHCPLISSSGRTEHAPRAPHPSRPLAAHAGTALAESIEGARLPCARPVRLLPRPIPRSSHGPSTLPGAHPE
jgi:hypothetical protein